MKTTVAAVAFTLICSIAFSQKEPIKFGDIPLEDLQMKSYDKDTTAEAVVLTDFGETNFVYSPTKGWQLNFERTIRIKILTKEGYSWADFRIPLYKSGSDSEKISGLKAYTYNLENGKVVETKMKSDAVFEEQSSANLKLTKFTLPNVKEGSVVDVTYKISSDFIFNYQDWAFQSTIPTRYSEYRASFPEFFFYETLMQGYIPLAINEKKQFIQKFTVPYQSDPGAGGKIDKGTYELNSNGSRYRWAAQNVPAFKEEPYLTTVQDYISKINFELNYVKYPSQPVKNYMGSWADLNNMFLENQYFGQPVRGSGFLTKTAEGLTAHTATEQEKVAAIYAYVKSAVIWDGRYRLYLDDNLKNPINNKKGSSAEINLLLVSLLQKAGLKADPVLISTRKHGFIREQFALSSQFNSVICVVTVDNKKILLDATHQYLPASLLPEECLNGKGYIISKESPGWVNITAPKSKKYTLAEITIDEGQLKGKISTTNDNYEAFSIRKSYYKEGEAEYLKHWGEATIDVVKAEFENMDKINLSVKENIVFEHQDKVEEASILYINPMLHFQVRENPFKTETRVYPVNFGRSTEQTFVCRITIPENYQVDEMPQNKITALPDNGGKFLYSAQVIGNAVTITSVVAINQPLFIQDEYPALREFFNLIVAKHAEQVVLKKK